MSNTQERLNPMNSNAYNYIRETLAILILMLVVSGCDLFSYSSTGSATMIALADDTMVPGQMKTFYREGAARLALREVRESTPLQDASPEIPAEKAENYYRALVHVFNMNSAWSDTVTKIIPIHTFPDIEMKQMIVSFVDGLDWTTPWRDGDRFTGNPSVDSLLTRYDLHLLKYYDWPWAHAVVLESRRFLNIPAVAKKFAAVDGVRYAESNSRMGDGNNIQAEWTDPLLLKLTYSFGYGDCPAGCINRRFWDFEVHINGTVNFLRAYGSPLPRRNY
jgi:hypothetical protein